MYYAVLWSNIFRAFATKLCAPTTYRRLDANVLPTFTMLRPFVGLVRICSREWFITYYRSVHPRKMIHVPRSVDTCQLGARPVDLVLADELHVHLPDAVRRPLREILPHALFAAAPLLAEEALQEAYHLVRPHDTRAKLLSPPHRILRHASDTVMATFEVRRSREVVVDEEANMPHAVCQEADISPPLVLLPASIRENVHLRR